MSTVNTISGYRVQLDCFQGPLDLLLYLVKNEELDVLEIALADIANQYLDYIEILTTINLDDVGEFLVLASTLMEIKSKLIIPREETSAALADVETETSRKELVRQLLEYKRFKEAGNLLWRRAEQQKKKLSRIADDLPAEKVDPSDQTIRELELWDLVSAFSRLMKENIAPATHTIILDQTPIEVYVERHAQRVTETGGLSFRDLIGVTNTKPQIIGKFLALLELIKQKRVWVEMNEETGDIWITPPRNLGPPISETAGAPVVVMADPSVPGPIEQDEPEESTAEEELDDFAFIDAQLANQPPQAQRTSAWDDFEPILDDESKKKADGASEELQPDA